MTSLAEPRPSRVRLRRVRPAALVAASLLLVLGTYAGSSLLGNGATHPVAPVVADGAANAPAAIEPAGAPSALSPGSLAQIDHSIGLWTANMTRNAKDFLAATYLGILYDARGRLTGDIGDYLRAQRALDQALGVVPTYMAARLLHARLLQTMHDFPGALAATQGILHDDPSQMQALATRGDAQLELGDLTGAESTFATLAVAAPGPAVTARLSRVAFLRGDVTGSRSLAQKAYDDAITAGQVGPSLGWYAYVAGTVALAAGAPTDAAAWFDKAVAAWPDSYLARAGKARAQAALGNTNAAIATYREAIAVAPQPDSLTLLGDLYALAGNTKLADNQYATVEVIAHLAAINQQVYNRQIVLFSVNHDRDLAAALILASQELAVRKDIYGYDAYAWALLANGRATEADAAMEHALSLGTKDATLWYHAGMIASAVGDTARAKMFLGEAVALRGALDPLAASRAAAALAALR